MNNKIKKNIKWILLVVIIPILIVVLFLNRNILFNKKLVGNKITNGLYEYKLDETSGIQNVIIKNDKVYYLINNDYTYKLKELDIYTNKTKEIGSIESDSCLVKNNYLSCVKEGKNILYDTNFKEVIKSDSFDIIPYNNSFLTINEKDIYFNDKKIRTIKDDIDNFGYTDYFVTKDNTFIEFVSTNDLYIYNVKDDSYEKIGLYDTYAYDKGLYYSEDDKLVVKDLINNSTKKYNNIKSEELYVSTIKDNLLIYIDSKYLKIYNLESNKIKILDYRFKNPFDKVVANDKYIYLVYQGENPKIYIVNKDEINSEEYSIDEYKKMQINKISNKVNELENKYNNYIDIIYDVKDINDYDKWDEKLVNEDKYELIIDALNAIDNVLDKLGVEFLSIFKEKEYDGLRIVIAREIIASKDSKIQNQAGFFFPNYTNYNVIVAKSDSPYEQTFCHEMMHAIDENAFNNRYDIAGRWYDYNPKKFEYGVKNYIDGNMDYTLYSYNEEEAKNAYFVDAYSKTNQSEDRARIFENVCYVGDENIIKEHENLLKKAKYIREELLKYYPSLNNSIVFDSIK